MEYLTVVDDTHCHNWHRFAEEHHHNVAHQPNDLSDRTEAVTTALTAGSEITCKYRVLYGMLFDY